MKNHMFVTYAIILSIKIRICRDVLNVHLKMFVLNVLTLLSTFYWLFINSFSFLRDDTHGCVISCAHYQDSGNPTYEKDGEKKCIPNCVTYGTIINLD